MATIDLGKWMITNGGNYNPESTYEQLTMVMYDNSTYITLKTVTGVTPSNDGVNYILMAQGFDATALSAVTATDTSGLLGDSGETVSAQSLVDYLADAVATKLLKKADISTIQSSSTNTVPASALLKATDDKIGDTSDLPGDAEDVVSAIVSLNSDLISRIPFATVIYDTSTVESATNYVNNPTTLFGTTRHTPYCILFTDNIGNSIFTGGITAIYGYTYANDRYGSQLCLKYGLQLKYRTKSDGVWTNLNNIQISN